MTTFTLQELNKIEVTKEEEEVFKTIAEMSREMGEVLPNELPNTTPDINTTPLWMVVNNLGAQLQLLSTVIKEGAEKREGDSQSLQDCVGSVLSQAEWFKEMVEEKVKEIVDDMDDEIESKVEDWLTNSFNLEDHVNIGDEIESKVEEVVEYKLRNASISVDF